MKEIDTQSEMIEACVEAGGAGHKLSNRFMVGVSDLLIKLPNWPACLIEVKMDEAPVTRGSVALRPTVPQLRFLRKYADAGMITGVASCVTKDREFGIAIVPVRDFAGSVRVLLEAHRWCLMGPAARRQVMIKELVGFLQQESR
jgi:hypothetical protein